MRASFNARSKLPAALSSSQQPTGYESSPCAVAHPIHSTFSLITSSSVASTPILSGNRIRLSHGHRAQGAISPSQPRNSTAAPISCVRGRLIPPKALSGTPSVARSARTSFSVRWATTRKVCSTTGLVGRGLSCPQWNEISESAPRAIGSCRALRHRRVASIDRRYTSRPAGRGSVGFPGRPRRRTSLSGEHPAGPTDRGRGSPRRACSQMWTPSSSWLTAASTSSTRPCWIISAGT